MWRIDYNGWSWRILLSSHGFGQLSENLVCVDKDKDRKWRSYEQITVLIFLKRVESMYQFDRSKSLKRFSRENSS